MELANIIQVLNTFFMLNSLMVSERFVCERCDICRGRHVLIIAHIKKVFQLEITMHDVVPQLSTLRNKRDRKVRDPLRKNNRRETCAEIRFSCMVVLFCESSTVSESTYIHIGVGSTTQQTLTTSKLDVASSPVALCIVLETSLGCHNHKNRFRVVLRPARWVKHP